MAALNNEVRELILFYIKPYNVQQNAIGSRIEQNKSPETDLEAI